MGGLGIGFCRVEGPGRVFRASIADTTAYGEAAWIVALARRDNEEEAGLEVLN